MHLSFESSVSILHEEPTKARRLWPLVMLLMTIALAGAAVAGRWLWGTIDEGVDSFADTLVSSPSSIGSLIGGNAASEIGDMVFLNHVQLLAGPQPNVFVISGAKGNQMLVVSEPGFSPPARSPITVDIKGRIRTLPPLVILRRQWKLSMDQIQSVGRQQAYIAAESIYEQKLGAKTD